MQQESCADPELQRAHRTHLVHRCNLALFSIPWNIPPAIVSLKTGIPLQLEYLRQARANPELRQAHRMHLCTGAIGAGIFFLEYAYPTVPLIHTAWHGLSAVSLWSLNALVEDADRRRMNLQFIKK
jgi:hypothetical protein